MVLPTSRVEEAPFLGVSRRGKGMPKRSSLRVLCRQPRRTVWWMGPRASAGTGACPRNFPEARLRRFTAAGLVRACKGAAIMERDSTRQQNLVRAPERIVAAADRSEQRTADGRGRTVAVWSGESLQHDPGRRRDACIAPPMPRERCATAARKRHSRRGKIRRRSSGLNASVARHWRRWGLRSPEAGWLGIY